MYGRTPSERELLEEHLEVVSERCEKMEIDDFKKTLLHQATRILDQIGEGRPYMEAQ